nr:hypothetical protein [Tanacetum cinerariifolium]
MSDSEHSSVTYTLVPSPVEEYSDIGSPKVDRPPSSDYVPGPEEPEQAPLSPDYVPSPEEPEQAPLLPDYVPGSEEPEQAPPSPVYLPYVPELVYPEYMPPEDDVFPAEEQPLPVAATPTADSPGYIPEFDPKRDLEEDDEEDPEEDPADYPADSTVVALLAVDHVPSEEKRLRFASPTPSQEGGESSAAGAARDRPVHRCLAVMIEREAKMAREAWGLSMDASNNAHSDVMSLHTTLVAHHALILDLQAAYRRRQGTQMIKFQKHHGPTKGLAQPDAPGEAGSSS